MSAGFLTLVATAVALGSWAGVAAVRRYALRHLLDAPNDRSSHTQPTPRGGGLALTVAHLVGVSTAALFGQVSPALAIALIGGGLAVAIIGFLDDHGHVSSTRRLACHFLAFVWTVSWIGDLPPVDFGWGPVPLGWAGNFLLLLYLTWFLNLFNFMDGIDGIAGMQALTMCATAVVLLHVAGYDVGVTLPIVLLGAATTGFLAWNWPPAKIFLGDVGSGYLGYALGAVALWTVVEGWLTPWVWLILGGGFLADATVTLLVRAKARAPLAEAHRSHAYQRLARFWRCHSRVVLVYLAVDLVWLAPWAWIATVRPSLGAASSVIALAPLFIVAVWLGAGKPGEIESR